MPPLGAHAGGRNDPEDADHTPKITLNRVWWGEALRRTIGALLKRGVVRSLAWRRGGAFVSGVTTVRLSV